MSTPFQVSVIIPVYNAEKFVRQAIESAVVLSQVGEVLAVNDYGPDAAWMVCEQLANELPKLRLIDKQDGCNRGAAASRNLGIQQARCDYVAFLDADDWYLPNRFEEDERILLSDMALDGVYNACGNRYESDEVRELWLLQKRPDLMTLSAPVPPDELPFVLFHGHPTVSGEFHTNTITVRRSFFSRVGLFHDQLRLQQDTHMWKRMSVAGKLAPGSLIEPVAIRRVHSQNRMTKIEAHAAYMDLWFLSLWSELCRLKAPRSVFDLWRRNYCQYLIEQKRVTSALWQLIVWSVYNRSAMLEAYGPFDIMLRSLSRNSAMVNRLLSMKNRVFVNLFRFK